jgi:multicomponent Na+:H+ antiporter subunit E
VTRTRLHSAGVVAWLAFVWVLLWGTWSWANVLAGVAVAVAVRVLLPLPTIVTRGRVHLPTLLRLVRVVTVDLVVSSLEVVWLSVRPGPPPRSAVVRSRVRVRSDLVLSLLVNTITLSPGSVVLEVDLETRVLHTHVLGVRTERDLARFQHKVGQLEDLFVGAFEAPVLVEEAS